MEVGYVKKLWVECYEEVRRVATKQHDGNGCRIRKKGPRKKRERKNRPRLEKRSTEITSTRKKRPQGNKACRKKGPRK